MGHATVGVKRICPGPGESVSKIILSRLPVYPRLIPPSVLIMRLSRSDDIVFLITCTPLYTPLLPYYQRTPRHIRHLLVGSSPDVIVLIFVLSFQNGKGWSLTTRINPMIIHGWNDDLLPLETVEFLHFMSYFLC